MLNIGKYLDEAGHIASILGYVGSMIGGKELPADAPEEGVSSIKGMAGFLGLKDERTVLSLMTRLFNFSTPQDPDVGKRAHAWVTKHMRYQEAQFELLKPQIGSAAVAMRTLHKNRLRNMLVDLPSSGGLKTGTEKVVKKLKQTTTTTTKDNFGKGSSDALDFLLLWGKNLQQNFDATDDALPVEEREALAFEAANMFLQAHQMPIPPKPEDIPRLVRQGKKWMIKSIRFKRDVFIWLEANAPEYWNHVKETTESTDHKVAVYARHRKIKDANRPWYIRWVDALL